MVTSAPTAAVLGLIPVMMTLVGTTALTLKLSWPGANWAALADSTALPALRALTVMLALVKPGLINTLAGACKPAVPLLLKLMV